MSTTQVIPEELIYEMHDGQPIYYRGYRQYLSGEKALEEIMGSSYLQSLIITQLVLLLGNQLSRRYQLLTNELGLQFAKNSWRAADLAIVARKRLVAVEKQDKYLSIPPEVVIEVDTKASLDDVHDVLGYHHKKTDALLDFGVAKVIWIFTESEKIMVAEAGESWRTSGWDTAVEVLEGVSFRVSDLIRDEEE